MREVHNRACFVDTMVKARRGVCVKKHVAIIGAGVAGLACARLLRAHNTACTILDKSRGVGGRMATRRVDNLQFDHGAQYFSVRGERFAQLVADWREEGFAAQWFDGAFVGAPGMTAPAHRLAAGHDILAGCEVRALRRDAEGWSVLTADGPARTPSTGLYSSIVFALPAPQIALILATAGLSFREFTQVRYSPCWALMLAFRNRMDLPWTHLRTEGGDLPWIARNSSKPMRRGEAETFVVHAGPDWTARNLECSPEEIAGKLLPLFRAATGVHDEPVFVQAHRWRYALVQQAAGVDCLWSEDAQIGACGDWCLGPRVENAFDSGEAMARRWLARRESQRAG